MQGTDLRRAPMRRLGHISVSAITSARGAVDSRNLSTNAGESSGRNDPGRPDLETASLPAGVKHVRWTGRPREASCPASGRMPLTSPADDPCSTTGLSLLAGMIPRLSSLSFTGLLRSAACAAKPSTLPAAPATLSNSLP